MKHTHALRALALAASCAGAAAQPAATLPNVQQLTPALPQAPADGTRLPAPARPAPELARPANETRLDVAGYDFDGAPPEALPLLADAVAPFAGPGRSHDDLLAAAAAVTRVLQSRLGLYLGYAYVPAQRPVAGRVRIQVLQGRLDRVVLEWPDTMPLDRAVVQALLDRLQPGAVLRIDEVERVVFLVNDLRGIRARFEFREGRDWGSAELLVRAEPEPRWQHKLDLDSDGSRYSGTVRLGWQALVASPLGRGDTLTLGAQASTTGGLAFALAGYTLPVGAGGLKLGASASAFRYRFDRELLPQDVRGHASATTGYALYPLRRSRNLNAFALASLERKRFSDRQGDELVVDKHTDELRLGLSGDFRDEALTGGVSTYELAANAGRVRYDRNAPAATDDAASFRKLAFGATRLQNVWTNRLLAYANLRGQHAFANLDATQQFRLGGADGVRAFAPGEAAGDGGLLATLELRMLPPEAWLGPVARELTASVFYDHGRVQLRHDTGQRPADFANHATRAGAGLGLVWDRPGRFQARVFAAWATQGTPTGDPAERKPRVYALVSHVL